MTDARLFSAASSHNAVAGDMAGPTLILVEANEDDRRIYETLFAFLGFGVVRAEHAGAAEEIAALVAETSPSLIVLGLGRVVLGQLVNAAAADMPRFVRALKDAPATQDVPLLVLTTHVDHAFREELVEAGADQVVLKPAPLSSVSAAVASLLRGDERIRCGARAATLKP